ncbi:MAG TPA: alkaline phosphatase, partial [Candidatus Krumholzibacterium sp.]|nr:alkaline phosphatase [Candidatus Krumholzibacterium sp.]
LVIVTGDHETGGFAVLDGQGYGMPISEAGWATGSHTAAMLPVFAYGPGEGSFAGVYENTMIGRKLISFLNTGER